MRSCIRLCLESACCGRQPVRGLQAVVRAACQRRPGNLPGLASRWTSVTSTVLPIRLTPMLPQWWPIATTGITVELLTQPDCLQRLDQARTGSLTYLQPVGRSVDVIPFRVDGSALVLVPTPMAARSSSSVRQLVLFKVEQVAADLRSGWTVVTVGQLVPRATEREGKRRGAATETFTLDLRALTGRAVSTT